MKKSILKYLLIMLCCLWMSGCVRMALNFSPRFIPRLAETVFEECDPDLAKAALPADLKLMEGLLKNDSNNRQLLATLCMGFAGYANLFVEDENPKRASDLYLRARDYGLRALGLKGLSPENPQKLKAHLTLRLHTIEKEDLEALMWLSLSWNAWIQLNLDKPSALAQIGQAASCLDAVLKVEPDHFHGLPYILKATILAATPVGGHPESAKTYFEKALQAGRREFLLAHYHMARYYAVRVQDKTLFMTLIEEMEKAEPRQLKGACLINRVMQEKAKHLRAMAEEWFL